MVYNLFVCFSHDTVTSDISRMVQTRMCIFAGFFTALAVSILGFLIHLKTSNVDFASDDFEKILWITNVELFYNSRNNKSSIS